METNDSTRQDYFTMCSPTHLTSQCPFCCEPFSEELTAVTHFSSQADCLSHFLASTLPIQEIVVCVLCATPATLVATNEKQGQSHRCTQCGSSKNNLRVNLRQLLPYEVRKSFEPELEKVSSPVELQLPAEKLDAGGDGLLSTHSTVKPKSIFSNRVNKNRLWPCNKCEQTFSTRKALRLHKNVIHLAVRERSHHAPHVSVSNSVNHVPIQPHNSNAPIQHEVPDNRIISFQTDNQLGISQMPMTFTVADNMVSNLFKLELCTPIILETVSFPGIADELPTHSTTLPLETDTIITKCEISSTPEPSIDLSKEVSCDILPSLQVEDSSAYLPFHSEAISSRWYCSICKKNFTSRRLLRDHKHRVHPLGPSKHRNGVHSTPQSVQKMSISKNPGLLSSELQNINVDRLLTFSNISLDSNPVSVMTTQEENSALQIDLDSLLVPEGSSFTAFQDCQLTSFPSCTSISQSLYQMLDDAERQQSNTLSVSTASGASSVGKSLTSPQCKPTTQVRRSREHSLKCSWKLWKCKSCDHPEFPTREALRNHRRISCPGRLRLSLSDLGHQPKMVGHTKSTADLSSASTSNQLTNESLAPVCFLSESSTDPQHKAESLLQCSQCGRYFPSVTRLSQHTNTCLGLVRHCEKCQRVFASSAALRVHLERGSCVSENGGIICSGCGEYTASDLVSLWHHQGVMSAKMENGTSGFPHCPALKLGGSNAQTNENGDEDGDYPAFFDPTSRLRERRDYQGIKFHYGVSRASAWSGPFVVVGRRIGCGACELLFPNQKSLYSHFSRDHASTTFTEMMAESPPKWQ